uniref:Isochorismatase family protein n=1 Tax=candidate division WOR-3 bacterium TaxID=2052148 RepID=A0A7V4E582_UNCW3
MLFTKERESHQFKLTRPVLLIVDLQSYFCHPESPAYLPGVEKILPKVEKLIKSFKMKGLPIFQTIHRRNSLLMEKWWRAQVKPEQTKPVFEDHTIITIKKDTYDAFYNTGLEEALKSLEIEQILIAGVRTHLCVETTARSAFVRGFEVVIPIDAVFEKDEWRHFSSLKNLGHGFAYLCEVEEILCALESLGQDRPG